MAPVLNIFLQAKSLLILSYLIYFDQGKEVCQGASCIPINVLNISFYTKAIPVVLTNQPIILMELTQEVGMEMGEGMDLGEGTQGEAGMSMEEEMKEGKK